MKFRIKILQGEYVTEKYVGFFRGGWRNMFHLYIGNTRSYGSFEDAKLVIDKYISKTENDGKVVWESE